MLDTAIRSIPGWETKTAEEIHSTLVNDFTWHLDNTLLSWAGLIPAIGQDKVALLRLKLAEWEADTKDLAQKAFLGLIRWALDNTKLDMSLESSQLGIDQLAGSLQTLGIDPEKIKELGRRKAFAYEQYVSTPPTLEDVERVKAEILTALEEQEANRQFQAFKASLIESGSHRWNAFVVAVDAMQPGDEVPTL